MLPKQIRQEIGFRLFVMQEDLAGNVKKLHDPRNLYRLRVGDYRVIFALEGNTITITISATERISIDEHQHS